MDSLFAIDWATLIVPTHSLVEMVVRGTLMYVGLFLILRFVMKRQTGAMSVADILLIVVIADAAQNGFAHEYRSVGEGFALVLTVVFWDFAIDWLAFRFPRIGKLLDPGQIQLVRNGRIIPANLTREMITRDELMTQLRHHGIEDLRDVRKAFLEGDGELSVIVARGGRSLPARGRREA